MITGASGALSSAPAFPSVTERPGGGAVIVPLRGCWCVSDPERWIVAGLEKMLPVSFNSGVGPAEVAAATHGADCVLITRFWKTAGNVSNLGLV